MKAYTYSYILKPNKVTANTELRSQARGGVRHMFFFYTKSEVTYAPLTGRTRVINRKDVLLHRRRLLFWLWVHRA